VPRFGWLALLPMVLCSLSGCAWPESVRSTSFMQHFRDRAISPDHAVIQVAAIYRPLGDGYINGRVWESANELFIDLERHAVLEENGFRVGQLVGAPPSDLQQLLLDPGCCTLKFRSFASSEPVAIYLNETPAPLTSFDLMLGKQNTKVELTDARYCLKVAAEFTSDGRTKLTFTPKVEHGETVLPFRASPEKGKWLKKIERAALEYPELSWQVTLEQNQCLLIGGRPDCLNTFGLNTFSQPANAGVQQLLVIRNCRSSSATEIHQSNVDAMLHADKTPPLALQASMPVYRSMSP
jgi:hypothetical protein